MSSGKFIVFEGNEGSGKSTILNKVCDWFDKKNIKYISTKEPGSKKDIICEKIRDLLLNPSYDIDFEAELFLYMADRSQHMGSVVIPAIKNGVNVLCDRHSDSTYSYQGFGRGRDINRIKMFNEISTRGILPNLTFMILCDPKIGLARVSTDEFGKRDRFEQEEIDFHNRVVSGYEDAFNKFSSQRKIVKIYTDTIGIEETYQKVLKELIKEF